MNRLYEVRGHIVHPGGLVTRVCERELVSGECIDYSGLPTITEYYNNLRALLESDKQQGVSDGRNHGQLHPQSACA